jgi:spermidine/putrescine transport system substrate-binding protein
MRTNRPANRRSGNRDAMLALLASVNGVDRRQFLKGVGAGGLLMLGGPALLAACSGTSADCEFASTGTGDNTRLNFANWPFYIDSVEDGWFDTSSLDDFTAATGIEVNYLEEVNDNNEWFGRVQAQLTACVDIQRDLTVLTDWMAARFIRLGWAEEIDMSKIPNSVNLEESLRSPGFDPNRDFTLPWQTGLTAIGYNPNLTGGELSSINDIFDPSLSGRVAMLTEMRDTLGLVMLGMDIDPAEASVDDAQAAVDKIQPYVDNGHIRRFTGNDYGDDLVAGNLAACFAWSGDVVQLQLDNPDLEFLVPEEGLMLWADNMMIPAGAANVEAAHAYMDYVYDPVVAAKIASWVNFIPPVAGARDALLALAEEIEDEELAELADDPLIFPDEETLGKTHIFKALDEEEDREFNDLFQALIGA